MLAKPLRLIAHNKINPQQTFGLLKLQAMGLNRLQGFSSRQRLHLMACLNEFCGYKAAHRAKTDDRNLHGASFSSVSKGLSTLPGLSKPSGSSAFLIRRINLNSTADL